MITDTLVTNEVKNAAGVEQEFNRISSSDRKTEFALVGESPAFPHRLTVSHSETGKGLNKRRRSLVRFDKTVESDVDDATPVTTSAYIVLDAPVGALTTNAQMKEVIANLMSFCASLGATSTILYDCSGNGASALVNGTL